MDNSSLIINIILLSIGFAISVIGLMFSFSFRRLDRWRFKIFTGIFTVLLTYIVLTGIWIASSTSSSASFAAMSQPLQVSSYFVGSLIMPFVALLTIKAGKNVPSKSMFFKIILSLEGLLIIILVTALFTDKIFYVSPDSLYTRGPFYWVMFIPPLIMLGANILAFVRYYPEFEIRYRKISIIFNLIPLICMCLQWIAPDILFITSGASLSAFILLTVLYRDQLNKYVNQSNRIYAQNSSLLALQMRPHYIFNVLTSIYYICEQDPRKAQTTIADFTSYLRKNFTAMVSEDTVSFADELEHARAYLAVEQVRFDGKISVNYDTAFTAFRLPPLTLQPIVENAVKHGIGPDLDPITVTIRTVKEKDHIRLTVENTGAPFEGSAANDDPHTALENIQQRLFLKCNATMEISSADNTGTIVTILIPVS